MTRRTGLAVALAMVAAVALVALRWHSLVPQPTPELPSSQPAGEHRAPHLVTPTGDLAYHEGNDDGAYDWQLAGRVIDDDGTPAAGARVELDVVCRHWGEEDVHPVEADGDGQFAVDIVPDCTIWLYAVHGEQSARMLISSLPGAPITVRLARDNDIVVHVIDKETREPVRGVHLTESFCPHKAACAEIIGDGTFRLGHSLSVHVRADGYTDGQVELGDVWAPRRGAPQLEQTVELYPLHRVTGRLLDVDGTPVAGAIVSVSYLMMGPPPEPPWSPTDTNGQFEVIAPANAWISAQKRCPGGSTGGWAEGVTVAATVVLHIERDYPCVPPQPRQPPPPPPPYEPPPRPPVTSVVLTVVDDTGHPVRDAQIRTFHEMMAPARTDAAGRAELTIDRPTEDLYARRGNRTSPVVAVPLDGRPHAYTLELRPAAITGIVVDRDGNPVARAWVRFRLEGLTEQPTYRELRTEGDGQFAAVLPAGNYRVSAFRETSIEDDYDAPNATVISTNTRDVTFEIP